MDEKTKSRCSAKTAAFDVFILNNQQAYFKLNQVDEQDGIVSVQGRVVDG